MKYVILIIVLLLTSNCIAEVLSSKGDPKILSKPKYYYENVRPEIYNIDYDMMDQLCPDCKGVDHTQFCPLVAENYTNMASDESMACERRYDENLNFDKPIWAPIIFKDINWDLIKSYVLNRTLPIMTPEERQADWERQYPRYYQRAKRETVFWVSSFNIDNDLNNIKEKVYRIGFSKCDNTVSNYRNKRRYLPNYGYFVENLETQIFDIRFSSFYSHDGGFFFYHGKTYSSLWIGNTGREPFFGTFFKILAVKPAVDFRPSKPFVAHGYPICLISERINQG